MVWFTGTRPQLLLVRRPAFRKAARSPWRGHFEGTGVHIIMRPVSSHMQSLCVCVLGRVERSLTVQASQPGSRSWCPNLPMASCPPCLHRGSLGEFPCEDWQLFLAFMDTHSLFSVSPEKQVACAGREISASTLERGHPTLPLGPLSASLQELKSQDGNLPPRLSPHAPGFFINT